MLLALSLTTILYIILFSPYHIPRTKDLLLVHTHRSRRRRRRRDVYVRCVAGVYVTTGVREKGSRPRCPSFFRKAVRLILTRNRTLTRQVQGGRGGKRRCRQAPRWRWCCCSVVGLCSGVGHCVDPSTSQGGIYTYFSRNREEETALPW